MDSNSVNKVRIALVVWAIAAVGASYLLHKNGYVWASGFVGSTALSAVGAAGVALAYTEPKPLQLSPQAVSWDQAY